MREGPAVEGDGPALTFVVQLRQHGAHPRRDSSVDLQPERLGHVRSHEHLIRLQRCLDCCHRRTHLEAFQARAVTRMRRQRRVDRVRHVREAVDQASVVLRDLHQPLEICSHQGLGGRQYVLQGVDLALLHLGAITAHEVAEELDLLHGEAALGRLQDDATAAQAFEHLIHILHVVFQRAFRVYCNVIDVASTKCRC